MPKKQQDGRYRTKVKIGVDQHGKDIVKYVSGRTKAELETECKRIKAYYIDGSIGQQDKLFGTYAVEWYKAYKDPYISASSRTGYKAALNKHILPVFGERQLRAIRAVEIQTWLNGYAGKSATQITYLMAVMKNVFSSACAERMIQSNPTLGLRRPAPKKPLEKYAFDADEKQRIIRAMDGEDGLFLAALYYLGLRGGEALGLQWGDIDLKEGLVHVQRDIDYAHGSKAVVGDLKTEKSDRYVTIPDALLERLQKIRGLPNAFLFPGSHGKPMPKTSYQRMWLQLMIDCGMAERIKDPRKQIPGKPLRSDIRFQWKATVTPHYFRHNYITMLYEAGVDVVVAMKLVGHSDIQTTINIYTHLKNEHLRKTKEKIDAAFSTSVELPKKLPLV
jgi:integrase